MKIQYLLLITLFSVGVQRANAEELTVFAAASLTEVMHELRSVYRAETGVELRLSLAASSALAKQIESGARADVFMPADQEWMDYLQAHELIQGDTRRDVVRNRLVLIAPRDRNVAVAELSGAALLQLLPARSRLAVADPDSVPAGRYARAALQSLGVWTQLEQRLVRAENVRATLIYVARGEAPLGIVYATDARVEPRVRVIAEFPAHLHAPITYPVALTTRARPQAGRLLAFLCGPRAAAIFRAAGFQ